MALSFTVAPYLALRFDELVRSRRQPDENLVFRLLHFEEAYKPLKVGILIRLELLMRDEIITSCICKRLLFMDSLTKEKINAHKRPRVVHTIESANGGVDIQIMKVDVYEEKLVSSLNSEDQR
ncbi:hypothetical protein Bca52824_048866 [Brassica carinata]|uniref:Uncharacterized protein n=1 Tax=Brassica carinata TaxID=52824 RepID=A0A8X7USJ3_BRACI|nr:hypothetical protein Bca52824_048866 [Brassica carinata]